MVGGAAIICTFRVFANTALRTSECRLGTAARTLLIFSKAYIARIPRLLSPTISTCLDRMDGFARVAC